MTSSEAPTTARWDLTWRRRRVLACSYSRGQYCHSPRTFLHLGGNPRGVLYGLVRAYFRDTLPPLSPAQDGPGDAAGVLALKEEGLGLAVLEAEDLAIGAYEELALGALLACCSMVHLPRPNALSTLIVSFGLCHLLEWWDCRLLVHRTDFLCCLTVLHPLYPYSAATRRATLPHIAV